MALAAADEHDQKLRDAVRPHQVLFDESAHQLMIALVHWDDSLDSPEIISAGVQRLRKQDADTVECHVMEHVSHTPEVMNGLSDNCPGMDGKFNGAMLKCFRALKAASQAPQFTLPVEDSELCAPVTEEAALLAQALVDIDQSRDSSTKSNARLTRTPCLTHLVSTLHDWSLQQAVGKAPPYKAFAPKINHILTFLRQQYYIFSTDHWDDIQEFLLTFLGANFDKIFTEPDLNRWLFTSQAVDEATDHGSLLAANRPLQFMIVFYYLVTTTRLNCDCEVVRSPTGTAIWKRDPQCIADNAALHGEGRDWGCSREYKPDQRASKTARQLGWYACLQNPALDCEAKDSTMIRLHLLAEAEFSRKLVDPLHFWSIGQSPELREYPIGFFDAPVVRKIKGGYINPYRRMHKTPASHRMSELSGFARDVMERANQMRAALAADFWEDPPSADEGCSELRCVAWCPFVDTMKIANSIQQKQWFHFPRSWRVADTLKETLREWVQGYLDKVDMWFPGLLLLPFAIGHFSNPELGPALARALIQAGCLQCEAPKWYHSWRPVADIDLQAERLVHESIVAASTAEYNDVYGVAAGSKAAKEEAAKAAMERRLKSGSIDTFGFLESIVAVEAALTELYTFASSRQISAHTTASSGQIQTECEFRQHKPTFWAVTASPHIADYPALAKRFNHRVRACLVSQQKLEAFFKDYRHGVSKQAKDDLKEACFMTKQNVYKRQSAEAAAGVQMSEPTYSKQDALDRLKARITASAQHAAAQSDIITDMAPHIGHGRQ